MVKAVCHNETVKGKKVRSNVISVNTSSKMSYIVDVQAESGVLA